MNHHEVDTQHLVESAVDLLEKVYHPFLHRVVCLVQDSSGKKFEGLSLNTSGQDICAEALAIGNSRLQSADRIDVVVAIAGAGDFLERWEIVPPCGNCRQLMQLYCPEAAVILPSASAEPLLVTASHLLPWPYTKTTLSDMGRREPP